MTKNVVINSQNNKLVFAIESSCDETAVAIVKGDKIINMLTHSQIQHFSYGGVVPEIAAREHLTKISFIVEKCFSDANIAKNDIDLIAVTASPGLIGALLVGVTFAKGMAFALKKPLKLVNHLNGHIFSCYLSHGIYQNFYCLLISGGHCQTIAVENFNTKQIVGKTIDDSVGEAFDKLAKKLGLGYPGGPIIEKLALKGNSSTHVFAVPMKGKNSVDFSFSGLKTHFLNIINKNNIPNDTDDISNQQWVWNLCASFQKVVADILIDRSVAMIKQTNFKYKNFVICGGVSANKYIRSRFEDEVYKKYGIEIIAPPLNLCTDNAAMIAAAAIVEDIENSN